MSDLAPPRPDRRAAESGSTYLFVLLVLFVLTVLGLSLSLVTQTEVQIGGAQKSATRVLFGADAGTDAQLASVIVTTEGPKRRYTLGAGTPLDDNIDTSPILFTHKAVCNLCKSNVGGEDYQVVNYVVNGEGRRLGQGSTVVQANKLVSTMLMVQPIRVDRAEEGRITFDPDLSADVTSTPGLDVIRY